MSPTQQDSHRRHAEYYSRVLHSADALFRRGYYNVEAGLRLFDLEWENIRMGQTWVADSPANNQALSELCIAYPNAAALALEPFTKNVGSASSLLGFIQLSVGAFASAGVGFLDIKGTLSTAAVMSISATLGFVILLLSRKSRFGDFLMKA